MKRLLSAALTFGVLCLLMNAVHVQRVASRTTPGFAQGVVMPLLDRAVELSELTHFDEVRSAFEGLHRIVRGGTSRQVGSEYAGGTRYLLAGDSVMESVVPEFAKLVEKEGSSVEEYIQRGSQVGDGYVDWENDLSRSVSEADIDVVLLMVGTYSVEVQEGSREALTLTRTLLRAGARSVVWLHHPAMRNTTYEEGRHKRYDALMMASREEPRLVVLDPGVALLSSQGGYSSYVVRSDGHRVRVREGDGVHLTAAGAQIFAESVIDLLAHQ